MVEITTADIKDLRNKTGVSIGEVKSALEEAQGDKSLALEILRRRGVEIAAKKSGRALGSGAVSAYIHGGGNSGTLVELSCETDFVAKNDEFKDLARDIAMHVAAMNPKDPEELLDQSFIKAPDQMIKDLINGATQKFGERIEVRRFMRFSVSD